MQTPRDHLWILQSQDGPHRATGNTHFPKPPSSHKKDLKSNGKYLEIHEILFSYHWVFFPRLELVDISVPLWEVFPLCSAINVPWHLSFTFVQGTWGNLPLWWLSFREWSMYVFTSRMLSVFPPGWSTHEQFCFNHEHLEPWKCQ